MIRTINNFHNHNLLLNGSMKQLANVQLVLILIPLRLTFKIASNDVQF